MFDQLIKKVEKTIGKIKDHRKGKPTYSIKDCLMSGLAMFSLKDPSLLSFIENYPMRQSNLEEVFKIKKVPTDNGLRTILDPINPDNLIATFSMLFQELDKQSVIKQRQCLKNHLAISIDGTGYFSSTAHSCPHCMVKTRKNGSKEYYHQLLGACIVHPNHKTVFPVFGEPITRQDGAKKNDCERNACKRFLPKIRQILPDKNLLVLFDGLYADGPTIKALAAQKMDYITVIKEGYVLVQIENLKRENKLKSFSWKKQKQIHCTAKWKNNLILNGTHQDIKVHYLEYEELDEVSGKIIYSNKWITNIEISKKNVEELCKLGRCRWKIENETFNTLKNQGYNLEHNYGHGKKYLSSLFALLMLMAFFIDQITQAMDATFEKALKQAKTLRDLRQKVRVLFDLIPVISMNFIYKIIAREVLLKPPQ